MNRFTFVVLALVFAFAAAFRPVPSTVRMNTRVQAGMLETAMDVAQPISTSLTTAAVQDDPNVVLLNTVALLVTGFALFLPQFLAGLSKKDV